MEFSTLGKEVQPQFLLLPAEIRNMIHTYVLQGHIFNVTAPSFRLKTRCRTYRDPLALLRTCRQIHAETLLMVFALNTFHIQVKVLSNGLGGGLRSSPLLLRSTTELHSLQSLSLDIPVMHNGAPRDSFTLLDRMPHLRTLQINMPFLDWLLEFGPETIEVTFGIRHTRVWELIIGTSLHVEVMEMLAHWKSDKQFSVRRVDNMQLPFR